VFKTLVDLSGRELLDRLNARNAKPSPSFAASTWRGSPAAVNDLVDASAVVV
jgi:hypothetical protein